MQLSFFFWSRQIEAKLVGIVSDVSFTPEVILLGRYSRETVDNQSPST